ncbi:hypothetical protein BVH03_22280 [Pseudomonas sp. PA15(2017)]|uniref:hypothetical protein n=1 Tax=Pseudomonas sp. PA15(2017) TaxID=1932111 RepID=UPI0009641976|nr:hypothetical protein [Pseudomonas sp. PA15(2017)]OLU22977.1 hypothetical protein BVH03_22280 [Pseudomonas sp. PA15(2017)]
MSEISHRLIRKAIRDLGKCTSEITRSICWAGSTAMIELAYAESLITGAEHDQYRNEVEQADRKLGGVDA